MRYLVTARVKPGRERALARAIENRTLGAGSVAGSEYLHNMETARLLRDGSVKWVEVCYCNTPLEEITSNRLSIPPISKMSAWAYSMLSKPIFRVFSFA